MWLTRSVSAHSVVTPTVRVDPRTRADDLLEFNIYGVSADLESWMR